MCGHMNFLICTDEVGEDTLRFCEEAIFEGEPVIRCDAATDWASILHLAGCFPSKGQARKNWKHGLAVTPGFHHRFVGKLKRELCVHRAIHEERDP